MYRLMLYFLLFLLGFAVILSLLRILPFEPSDIIFQSFYLTVSCWFFNRIFASIFKVKVNTESSLISGLILSLTAGPVAPISNLLYLTAISFFAMGSKYFLAFGKKHIFNPAAFGVLTGALIFGQGASWWIGDQRMILPVVIGGFLILKKISRFEEAGIFLFSYAVLSFAFQSFSFSAILNSPLIFFTAVMLIEPKTSPHLRLMQIIYAVFTALVFSLFAKFIPQISFGLELSLLAGNIFSYLMAKNFRQVLTLIKKEQLSRDCEAFIFKPEKKIEFEAGQFLEWTLSHEHPDSRGIRRFFTIASSPTEDFIMLASKFYPNPSTFKIALKSMDKGGEIIASDLAGEFTLPEDKRIKLVFIAGGIGITPFRSQVKYMLDKNEKRDIVLLYSNKTAEDIVFRDLFDSAQKNGVRTVYVNNDQMGYINEKVIKEKVPDWRQRIFYISGPEPMVEAFEKILAQMGLERKKIRRDYFPGYTERYTD